MQKYIGYRNYGFKLFGTFRSIFQEGTTRDETLFEFVNSLECMAFVYRTASMSTQGEPLSFTLLCSVTNCVASSWWQHHADICTRPVTVKPIRFGIYAQHRMLPSGTSDFHAKGILAYVRTFLGVVQDQVERETLVQLRCSADAAVTHSLSFLNSRILQYPWKPLMQHETVKHGIPFHSKSSLSVTVISKDWCVLPNLLACSPLEVFSMPILFSLFLFSKTICVFFPLN